VNILVYFTYTSLCVYFYVCVSGFYMCHVINKNSTLAYIRCWPIRFGGSELTVGQILWHVTYRVVQKNGTPILFLR